MTVWPFTAKPRSDATLHAGVHASMRAGMCVGIDVRLAHWPGIGRYIEEIVSHMVRDFPQTDFVLFTNAAGPNTLRAYADPRLQRRLSAPNVRFVPCRAQPFALTEPWQFGSVVRAQTLDVMHSPYINIPWLGSNVPLVVTLHDFRHPDLALQAKSPRSWAKRTYYEALTRLALHRAARVVSVSQFLAQQLLEFQPALAGRLEVITHAAGADFAPLPRGEAAAEVAHHFALVGRYFLFVGTLKPHKNLLAVVRALAHSTIPADVQLAVAAAPDDRYPEVMAAVKALALTKRVHFLGHVEKHRLPALYGAARATLLPSSYESFGLPVIESMACGTPVIAAPLASLPEVGGLAAWYAAPTPEGLSAAMQTALFDDADHARRVEAGLLRARQFSWQRAAAALHQVYENVARAKQQLAPSAPSVEAHR
jgi:glycosyltransferase involved in cell wall biosynthesis